MPLTSTEPTQIELPDLKLVGACQFADFFAGDIGAAYGGVWDRFFAHMGEIKGLKKDAGRLFGLERYPPGFPKDEKRWYYMACAEVEALEAAQPASFMSCFVPAARYAKFTHRGTIDGLAKAFRVVYDEWLPRSGVKLLGTHDLEHYGEGFTGPGDPDSEIDILLPLA